MDPSRPVGLQTPGGILGSGEPGSLVGALIMRHFVDPGQLDSSHHSRQEWHV